MSCGVTQWTLYNKICLCVYGSKKLGMTMIHFRRILETRDLQVSSTYHEYVGGMRVLDFYAVVVM